jgi:hypothetical protein
MTINWVEDEIIKKYSCILQIVHAGKLNTLLNECHQYLNLYETLCAKVLKFEKPFLPDKMHIAEAIYRTKLDDESEKSNRTYYRANCSAFSIVFNDILNRFRDQTIQESALRKLRGLTIKHIRDSLRLINHYQDSIRQDKLFAVHLTNSPDFSIYYDTCEQIIFGEASFDDYSDQSEVTPALIRVMIELRLKWSMGIDGYLVNKKPGNMSDFFEVFDSFEKHRKVIINPRYDIVKKIYKWGNTYVHTGTRSYTWLTGFALDILKPLFYGEKHRLSGVRVESLATIYAFWDELKNHYVSRSHDKLVDVKISPYTPGFICTNITFSSIPCKNHYAIYENAMQESGCCKDIAVYNMKCILREGIPSIGNVLYERVRNSYISLREYEIRERAYYLWLRRDMPLWDDDCDWYYAIEDDIAYLPKPTPPSKS